MDRGTPATEPLGGTHSAPDHGRDPRTADRREAARSAAPHPVRGYDEIHVEAHIILSEN